MNNRVEQQADIHLSIVSHGQWHLISSLLQDLSQLSCCQRLQVTLTFNILEETDYEPANYPFDIHVINNETPKGFGENHNNAFNHLPHLEQRRYFVVVNPDIHIQSDVFVALIETMQLLENNSGQTIGVIAPSILNSSGELEDSARAVPTPGQILAKVIGQRKRWQNQTDEPYYPDWVAGMFMCFNANTFEKLGGFNTAYFLYYEDVELCSRLWLQGFSVCVQPQVSVIHDAQRSSHRNLKYMRWHISSMLRFFLSSTYRQVKKLHARRTNKNPGESIA